MKVYVVFRKGRYEEESDLEVQAIFLDEEKAENYSKYVGKGYTYVEDYDTMDESYTPVVGS